MKKIISRLIPLLIITAAFFLAVPAARASAAEYTNESHYLKIDISDDVLIMTQDTPKYDEVWTKAGVSDPSAQLDSFKGMGVIASFFEPSSGLTVNVITNRTSSTGEVFSFAQMSDDGILNYMNNAMAASSQTTTVAPVLSVNRDLNTLPLVRIYLDARTTDNPCSEVIYGTIVNGEMIQFDTFREGTGDLDESFLQTVVRNVAVTRILTKDEYEDLVREARIKLAIIAAVFVLLIAGVIFLFIFLGKRRDRKAKAISDAMTDFRERMAAGKIDMSVEPKYTVRTHYDVPLFERFGMFRTWICPEPSFIVFIAILAVFTVFKLMQGSLLHVLILAVIIVVLLYMHYSATDKVKEALIKRYDVKAGPDPTFRFYDEFFKVTGLPSASEYIYSQVTAVRIWSGTLYIFLGSSQVLPIRIEDLTGCTAAELKKMIRSHK